MKPVPIFARKVVEAGSGAEALSAIVARPDVRAVFTDVQMPGSPDGLAFARHVRQVKPDCAIVIASGRVMPLPEELVARALFITKPYSVDAVVAAFDKLLAT